MNGKDIIAIVLAALILVPVLAFGAEEEKGDEGDYEYKTWKLRRSHAGFSGHGGFWVSGLGVGSDDLDQLTGSMGISDLDGRMWGMGGYGLGHLGNGWRIGGGGGGLSAYTDGRYVDTATDRPYNRQVRLDMGYGGFMVEYSPFMFGPVNFGAGALLGGGGISLELRQDTGSFGWEQIHEPYTSPPSDTTTTAGNINTRIDQPFFVGLPYVTARVHILDWMAAEATAGYFFTTFSSDGWYYNEDKMAGDGPDIDLEQPYFRFGLVFGG